MKGLFRYVQDIWGRRFFWLSLVHMDLRARYRGSIFGMGWSLLHPIAMTAILCAVFCTMFQQKLADFAPYLMAGLTLWTYITSAALQGCQCFFVGETYIRQHPAPMAIYPLRTTLGAAFHFAIGYLLVIALAVICHGALPLAPAALLSLIPTLALCLAAGWSLAILFGLATVRFRDFKHLSEVGFQGLFYLSPVMYAPEQVANLMGRRTLGWIFTLNPVVPFLELVRAPVVAGQAPAPAAYATASLITLGIAVAAGLALRSEERKIIFHL